MDNKGTQDVGNGLLKTAIQISAKRMWSEGSPEATKDPGAQERCSEAASGLGKCSLKNVARKAGLPY